MGGWEWGCQRADIVLVIPFSGGPSCVHSIVPSSLNFVPSETRATVVHCVMGLEGIVDTKVLCQSSKSGAEVEDYPVTAKRRVI